MVQSRPWVSQIAIKKNKNSLIKTRQKPVRTFHVRLFFQVANESYLIYCAANNNSLTKLTQCNSFGECTFRRNQQTIRVLLKGHKKWQEFIASVKKYKQTNESGVILFFCFENFMFEKMTSQTKARRQLRRHCRIPSLNPHA